MILIPSLILLLSLNANPVLLAPLPASFNLTATIKPGNDFYRHVNQAWLDTAYIPSDQSSINSFYYLAESNRDKISSLIDHIITNNSTDPLEHLISGYYHSALDIDAINITTQTSIQPYIDEINAIHDIDGLFNVLGKHQRQGVSSAFFEIGASPDLRNSSWSMAWIGSSGLGLGDRDYYFQELADVVAIRQAYLQYLATLFQLTNPHINLDQAMEQANLVLRFETELANATLTNVEARDYEAQFNLFQYSNLSTLFPGIPWQVYASACGLKSADHLIALDNPKFYTGLAQLLDTTPLASLKIYLLAHFIRSAVPYLSETYLAASFELSKVMSGVKQRRPRWKTALAHVDTAFGDAIGKLYVAQYFPAESKADIKEMIQFIIASFRDRLVNRVEWMTSETRTKAIAKLDSLNVKIGYPDKWKDFSGLFNRVSRDRSFFLNRVAISEWEYEQMVSMQIDQPVDKAKWGMNPQTVNAYYSPLLNEIVFPAAILMEPFYKAGGDVAQNFGSIGMVIAHEITHGFDDSGRKFDAQGNLKDWWQTQDAESFTKRADKMIAKYDLYPVQDEHVNGALTAGENIADLGGGKISFHAMQEYIKANGIDPIDAFGIPATQRYFIYFAQLWRTKSTAAYEKLLLKDTHSPAQYRVNGVCSNMPEFYEAFNVLPGDDMYLGDDVIEIF